MKVVSGRRAIPSQKQLEPTLPCAALRESVPLSDLTESLLCAYDSVARLASKKSPNCGAQRGCEVADWVAAEHEILGQMQVDFAESEGAVTALASLPGYRSAEVSIGIEPRCLLIFGCHESEDRADGTDLRSVDPLRAPTRMDDDSFAVMGAHAHREPFPARSASKDYQASHLFCMLELPAEVDPAHCTAILSNGLLGIHMTKAIANTDLSCAKSKKHGANHD
jgi:HSP20 family molecular chaperone IbpA